jgi:bifunctional non-homologous end joining protein LigD
MATLDAYRKKRDFRRTAEPRGEGTAVPGALYVVQKHAARRLHYDLRLELGGVLKSWAVTRGPSLVPSDKRLAVEVEDHPVDYAGFEGDIPAGEYGGGSVIVWDRGSWRPIGDPEKGLAKGHLEFAIEGEKLGGRWHLIRLKGRKAEARVNWLLVKAEDEHARTAADPDILEERPESVKSGRLLPGETQKPARRTRARPASKEATPEAGSAELPEFIPPALATLAARPPRGKGYVHEIKFDGYRLHARIDRGEVKLITRAGLDWTAKFGRPIVEALVRLPVKQAIMDCELVVENDAGASDFAMLQAALSAGATDRMILYAFDLMHVDGEDCRPLPLTERKERLKALLPAGSDLIRYSEHFGQAGDSVLQHSCRLSLEGIISKLATAPYVSGRSGQWIKSKCTARQEFVIGGYAVNAGDDRAVGSLVLGVHENGKLRHVGRVGTGWSRTVAHELLDRLRSLDSSRSPFAGRLTALQRRDIRFVKPELVAEVEFRGWTADVQVRHATFRGLRDDKPARDVVRETPLAEPVAEAVEAPEPRRSVALSNPDRVLWPDPPVTKAMLADYYAAIWPMIAPFVASRPLSIVRCPDGIDGERFFQKHPSKGRGSRLLAARDPKDGSELIAVNDLDGLLSLVQMAALEIHPWGATLGALETPDTLTMDLDPGEGVPFATVKAAALEVKERLEAAGLAAFLKTSGGKGLHVVSPLKPACDFDALKRFTQRLAASMAKDAPSRYVATVAKDKRKGRILIDYLRNQRGATAVAAYSTRARPGAPVSVPLRWDEFDGLASSAAFTLPTVPARLTAEGHAWPDFRRAARPLEAKKAARAG